MRMDIEDVKDVLKIIICLLLIYVLVRVAIILS